MREQLARWVAALTAVLMVLLALAFAWLQNPASRPPASIAAPPVLQIKQQYQALEPNDLDALVAYLASLAP